MTAKERIINLGWNLSPAIEAWEEDGHLFFAVDPDDVTGYIVEINPETGASRHKGNGQGCFWTDWEDEEE